mmetsp:Transcript_3267/g.303  ORF Transcript_3267/g.303 Transcript_3267/m.303 type:complete len:227 (+) Transcript_3267:124-804(+)
MMLIMHILLIIILSFISILFIIHVILCVSSLLGMTSTHLLILIIVISLSLLIHIIILMILLIRSHIIILPSLTPIFRIISTHLVRRISSVHFSHILMSFHLILGRHRSFLIHTHMFSLSMTLLTIIILWSIHITRGVSNITTLRILIYLGIYRTRVLIIHRAIRRALLLLNRTLRILFRTHILLRMTIWRWTLWVSNILLVSLRNRSSLVIWLRSRYRSLSISLIL